MSTTNKRFNGRCVIITGGASGLGKETAKQMVAEGANVVLWDINVGALHRARAEVGASHVIALDVSDP